MATFYADDKFEDVAKELIARGWTRSRDILPANDLTWSNYARIKFDQLREDCFVNHLRCIDVLSNKAKLAKLMEEHGLNRFVPATWSHMSAISLEEFLFDPQLSPEGGNPTYWIVKPVALSCGR